MNPENEEMRPEYDIRGGVRGKYFRQTSDSGGPQGLPWIQPQPTASNGKHATQSTFRIVAETSRLTLRVEAVEPAAK